jgi:hypothetical protein
MKYFENLIAKKILSLLIACSSALLTNCGSTAKKVSDEKKSNTDYSAPHQQETSNPQPAPQDQQNQNLPLTNSELRALSPLKVIREKYSKANFVCKLDVTIPTETGSVHHPDNFTLNLLNNPSLPANFKNNANIKNSKAQFTSDLTLDVTEVTIAESLTSTTNNTGTWSLSFSPSVNFALGGSSSWKTETGSGTRSFNKDHILSVGEVIGFHSSTSTEPKNNDGNILNTVKHSITCELDLELKPQYKGHKVKL